MQVSGWRRRRISWSSRTASSIAGCAALVVFFLAGADVRLEGQQSSDSAAKVVTAPPALDRALFNRYCVTCHNERTKTAGLMLDRVDLSDVAANAAVLEKVVIKLRGGLMPPGGRPRPESAVIDQFVGSLESALDRAAAASPDPGRVAAHRLNRLEYVSAVEDLFGLKVDQALLPPDALGVGFDNNGQFLSITPSLMHRYMSAAYKIARLAVADPTTPVSLTEYKASLHAEQTVRTSEDLPFGTKGGFAIRHNVPLDGEYVLKVRLQRNSFGDTIRGVDEEVEIQLSVDHELVARLTVGGEYKGYDSGLVNALPDDDVEGNARHRYRLVADEHLDVRVPLKAGSRLVSAAFTDRDPRIPERVPMLPIAIQSRVHLDDAGDPGIDRIEIVGPYDITSVTEDTVSRRRIFTCRPANEQEVTPCARQIVSRLATRAYRRPVSDAEVGQLMGLFEEEQGGFDAGIGLVVEALLSSPLFLFRVEEDPADVGPGAAYRVSDLELASRLSFALWRSIPDDELLDLAVNGRLRDQAVRTQQVHRMLADPRANRWMDDFMEQWLAVRSLQAHEPAPRVFPGFDDALREAMETETRLFFESQVREDWSLVDLLRADYTYLNEQLAAHYGVPGVHGPQFRKVKIADPRRQGLLGHGSILTTTSYADRTSVVLRGKWVLSTLLASPPPPPPADVPSLEDNKPGAPAKSLRERMEQHRSSPVCASCHAPMDPMGFVLENFDATGRWRDSDAGAAIDSVATTPLGLEIEGPSGLREHLLGRRDEFMHAVTTHLMEYFLGRSLDHSDRPAVRGVLRAAAADDYRWSSLILNIVESVPFQMRRAAGPQEVSVQAAVADRQ